MKIVTVVGARPQFIKAAAVSRAIGNWNDKQHAPKIKELLVHTGQHYDSNMSEVFFDEMRIPTPHRNLDVGSGSHGFQTGKMLAELEKLIVDEHPDAVIVYGDTNSTLAGALAASKMDVPVVHIEAGLRSYNKSMPEEQNRVLTDHISTVLFCPTKTAITNLEKEGICSHAGQNRSTTGNLRPSKDQPEVILCGDVMYDCVLFYSDLADTRKSLLAELDLMDGDGQTRPFILATIHRQENTDVFERLYAILSALKSMSEEIPVVLPLHPRTAKLIGISDDLKSLSSYITVCEPLSYFEMILLEKNCQAICTDSGGVQKEAYFFKKPCITMREQTEWVETVEQGWNMVVDANDKEIVRGYSIIKRWILHNDNLPPFKKGIQTADNLFGDGRSSNAIVSDIVRLLN